jgi:hypothetical protein
MTGAGICAICLDGTAAGLAIAALGATASAAKDANLKNGFILPAFYRMGPALNNLPKILRSRTPTLKIG